MIDNDNNIFPPPTLIGYDEKKINSNFEIIYFSRDKNNKYSSQEPEVSATYFNGKSDEADTEQLSPVLNMIDKKMSVFEKYFISHVSKNSYHDENEIKNIEIPDFEEAFSPLMEALDLDDTIAGNVRLEIRVDNNTRHPLMRSKVSAYVDIQDKAIMIFPSTETRYDPIYTDIENKIYNYVDKYILEWFGNSTTGVISVTYNVKSNKEVKPNKCSIKVSGNVFLVGTLLLQDDNNLPEIVITQLKHNPISSFKNDYKKIIEDVYSFLCSKEENKSLAKFNLEDCKWIFHYPIYTRGRLKNNGANVSFDGIERTINFVPHKRDEWERVVYFNNCPLATTKILSTKEVIGSSRHKGILKKLQQNFYNNLTVLEKLREDNIISFEPFNSYENAIEKLEVLKSLNDWKDVSILKSSDSIEPKYVITGLRMDSNIKYLFADGKYAERIMFDIDKYFNKVD